jgi:hypothetical protein
MKSGESAPIKGPPSRRAGAKPAPALRGTPKPYSGNRPSSYAVQPRIGHCHPPPSTPKLIEWISPHFFSPALASN